MLQESDRDVQDGFQVSRHFERGGRYHFRHRGRFPSRGHPSHAEGVPPRAESFRLQSEKSGLFYPFFLPFVI